MSQRKKITPPIKHNTHNVTFDEADHSGSEMDEDESDLDLGDDRDLEDDLDQRNQDEAEEAAVASGDTREPPPPELIEAKVTKSTKLTKNGQPRLILHYKGRKYVFAGYRSFRGVVDQSRQKWRCSERNRGYLTNKQMKAKKEKTGKETNRNRINCPGLIWVILKNGKYFVESERREHSHGSDLTAFPIMKVKCDTLFENTPNVALKFVW